MQINFTYSRGSINLQVKYLALQKVYYSLDLQEQVNQLFFQKCVNIWKLSQSLDQQYVNLNYLFNYFIQAFGDFNKGIVGDSERMLNEIADRAQLIPWETCFLLVDEIDSLAPDRTGSQG